MKNKFLTVISIALGFSFTCAQEIMTWAGGRAGAAAFTFDDNLANQLSIAVPIFDKYGYPATFYVVTGWGPNYSTYQNLVAKGYEVGSHSDSHGNTMGNNEISSSKNTINSRITNQTCNTIAYPNCNVPSDNNALNQNYIAGRICNNQVEGASPRDYLRIGSIICGNTGSVNSAQAFQQKMQEAINKGGWVTFLIHEVDQGSGYSPTSSQAIDGALSWAKQNDSKIWVSTFRNLTMYSKERDNAKITKVSGDANSETYSLTHTLSTTISAFDYPLTIKVQNTNNWSTVKATQKGVAINASIRDGSIYFDAVPNGGDIVISNGAGGSSQPTNPTPEQPSTPNEPSSPTIIDPVNIPNKVEAENYSSGTDSDNINEGDAQYRTNEGVDIVLVNENNPSAGMALGYTAIGESVTYKIHALFTGDYTLEARVASGTTNSGFTVSIDNNQVATFNVQNTGDWQTYTTMKASSTIPLTEGEHTVTLNITGANVNIDWLNFSATPPEALSQKMNFNSSNAKFGVFSLSGARITTFEASSYSAHEHLKILNIPQGIYYLKNFKSGKIQKVIK